MLKRENVPIATVAAAAVAAVVVRPAATVTNPTHLKRKLVSFDNIIPRKLLLTVSQFLCQRLPKKRMPVTKI